MRAVARVCTEGVYRAKGVRKSVCVCVCVCVRSRKLSDLTIGPVLTWTTDAMMSHVDKLLKIPGEPDTHAHNVITSAPFMSAQHCTPYAAGALCIHACEYVHPGYVMCVPLYCVGAKVLFGGCESCFLCCHVHVCVCVVCVCCHLCHVCVVCAPLHPVGAKVLFGGRPLTDHSIPAVYGAIEPTAVFVPLKEALKPEHFDLVTTELFGPFQVRHTPWS